MEPVRWHEAERQHAIALLGRWRERASPFFPAQFPVTLPGSQRWLLKQLLEVPDRILFWVRGSDGRAVGHVGLFRFDWDDPSVEIDNIVRGEPGILPGVIHHGVCALLAWTLATLHMDTVFLPVPSVNQLALKPS